MGGKFLPSVYNPTLAPINMFLCWTWSRQFLKTRNSAHLGPAETNQRHKKAPERSQRKKDPSDNSRLCFLGKLTAPKNPPISVTYTNAGFVLWSLLACPGHRLLFRLLKHTHTHTHTHTETHTETHTRNTHKKCVQVALASINEVYSSALKMSCLSSCKQHTNTHTNTHRHTTPGGPVKACHQCDTCPQPSAWRAV